MDHINQYTYFKYITTGVYMSTDVINNAKNKILEERSKQLRYEAEMQEALEVERRNKVVLLQLEYEDKWGTRERYDAEADAASARKRYLKLKSLYDACLSNISNGEAAIRQLTVKAREEQLELQRQERKRLQGFAAKVEVLQEEAEEVLARYVACVAANEQCEVMALPLTAVVTNPANSFKQNVTNKAVAYLEEVKQGVK
jgi:hypothetical protein